MSRDTLGDFEQLVLLACLRLSDSAYTVSILNEIQERTGRRVAHSAVYVALKRLEGRGMVASRVGESTAERGGRAKRFFRVLPAAIPELTRARDHLMAMWDGLDPEGLEEGARS